MPTEFHKIVLEVVAKVDRNIQAMNKVLNSSNKEFGDMITKTGQMNRRLAAAKTPLGRFSFWLRQNTAGLRGFRMEMLGVMFFGMGLQRFFMGLLQPSLELAGVFKIWTTTLKLLFLPIALAILPFFIEFLNIVISLPQPTKLLIGALALLGVGLGGLLFIIGTVTLGIGSLIVAFGPLTLVIGGVLLGIAALVGGLVGFQGLSNMVGEETQGITGEVRTMGIDFDGVIMEMVKTVSNFVNNIDWNEVRTGLMNILSVVGEVADKLIKSESIQKFVAIGTEIAINIGIGLIQTLPKIMLQVVRGIGKGIENAIISATPKGFETYSDAIIGLPMGTTARRKFLAESTIRPSLGSIKPFAPAGGHTSIININVDKQEFSSAFDMDKINRDMGDMINREVASRFRGT